MWVQQDYKLHFPMQRCWQFYHTGTFDVVDGNEIYCTLCGDGGEIVCCDNSECASSFCRTCIRRIVGEEYLKSLLDENATWNCFCCDTTPLQKYYEMCNSLCEYYRKEKVKRKKLARLQRGPAANSDTDSDHFVRILGRPESLRDLGSMGSVETCEKENEEGGLNGGERGGSGSGDGGGGGRGGGGKGGKMGGERGSKGGQSGRGGSSGGRDKKGEDGDGRKDGKRSNKKKQSDESYSESDDTSGDEDDDSPQVDTDDVSLSDVSLFSNQDGHSSRKADKKREKSHDDVKSSKLTEEGKSERSPAGKPDKLKKKTKRLSHGPLAHRMIISSDSENDFESFTKSMTSHKRTRSSSSSSDSSQINRGGRRKKKSHLLHTLSSGSDNEKTPQKMEVSTFQDISDRSTSLPNVGVSPGLSDHPIVYATPRSMSASSDSDEVSVLKRKTVKKGSNRLHGLSDSDEDDVVKVEETPKSKDVKKKTRTRKREEISSGDDFEMRGTQLKRRRVTRALFSDSDSNSTKQSGGLDDSGGGSDDSGEEAEREEEEEKSTPGRKRKKIRKLFTDEKLQASTKEAQRLEKERIERLKKRQVVMKEKENELVLEVDSVTKKVCCP